MNYAKYNVNGKEYNLTPVVELCKRKKWEGTIKYMTQTLGIDQDTAIRIRAEVISNLKNNEATTQEAVPKKKIINRLEELYDCKYKGSKLDISAVLVYVRKNNDEGAVSYLTNKGIEKNDANQICGEVKELLKEDVTFSNDHNSVEARKTFLGEVIYSIDGNRGRHLDVYEDFAVITVAPTVGAVLTGNATDGTKIIFYTDCVGLQFKEPGVTIGYLQLETASASMNNTSSNYFNENTFTFDVKQFKEVFEVYKYIFNRMRAIKTR